MGSLWESIKSHPYLIGGGAFLIVLWVWLRASSASNQSQAAPQPSSVDPGVLAANTNLAASMQSSQAALAQAAMQYDAQNQASQEAAQVAVTTANDALQGQIVSAQAGVATAQIGATGAVNLANAQGATQVQLAGLGNIGQFVNEELASLTTLGKSYTTQQVGGSSGTVVATPYGVISTPGNSGNTVGVGGLAPGQVFSLFQNIVSQVSAIAGVAPAQTTPTTTAPQSQAMSPSTPPSGSQTLNPPAVAQGQQAA